MKRFKNYETFLLEWKLRDHWLERSSLSHEDSRVLPKDRGFKDGWTCDALLLLDKEGNPIGNKISYSSFLKETGMSKEDFETKVSFALHKMVVNERAKKKYYADTERLHRFVCMGKVAFQFGEKFYSPLLTTEHGTGNVVWGDVKNNQAFTIMYFPENATENDFFSHAKLPKNRLKGAETLSSSDYKELFRVEHFDNDKNRMIVIPDSPDWKIEVEKQAETGNKWKEEGVKKTPEEIAWQLLFRPDVQTVFDNGTKIYLGQNRVRTVTGLRYEGKDAIYYLLNEEGVRVSQDKKLSPGDTISIVSPKEADERELGKLPTDGLLVKRFKIQRFFKQKDKKGAEKGQLMGELNSIFVVSSSGEEIFSKISKS